MAEKALLAELHFGFQTTENGEVFHSFELTPPSGTDAKVRETLAASLDTEVDAEDFRYGHIPVRVPHNVLAAAQQYAVFDVFEREASCYCHVCGSLADAVAYAEELMAKHLSGLGFSEEDIAEMRCQGQDDDFAWPTGDNKNGWLNHKNGHFDVYIVTVEDEEERKMEQFMLFDTHNGDSQWNDRSGQMVEVLRKLTDAEADVADVGPMFRIKFSDGVETDAFEDELITLDEKVDSTIENEEEL